MVTEITASILRWLELPADLMAAHADGEQAFERRWYFRLPGGDADGDARFRAWVADPSLASDPLSEAFPDWEMVIDDETRLPVVKGHLINRGGDGSSERAYYRKPCGRFSLDRFTHRSTLAATREALRFALEIAKVFAEMPDGRPEYPGRLCGMPDTIAPGRPAYLRQHHVTLNGVDGAPTRLFVELDALTGEELASFSLPAGVDPRPFVAQINAVYENCNVQPEPWD